MLFRSLFRSGEHGSGKSTLAVKLADKLGYQRYYIGQILRNMAKEKGMIFADFLELFKKDQKYDREVDDYVVKLGQSQDNFVIESRTAWHFIPQSLKIYLKTNDLVAAKRMFLELQANSENRKNESNSTETLEDVLRNNRQRKKDDDSRYKKYYGIDVNKMENYDFVLDTTNLTREEVLEQVLQFVVNYNNIK